MHHSSREADRRAAEALRRDLLLLIHAHLLEEGLTEAAEAMRQSPLLFSPESYEVCDNVDLNLIMMEYCGYYQVRFNMRKTEQRYRFEKPTHKVFVGLTSQKVFQSF